MTRGFGLAFLFALGGWALAGPSGIIAWGEQDRLLEKRKAEIAELAHERDRLQNRVDLMDPAHADPDLTGELLRSQLNVAHEDEMVLMLD